MQDVNLIAEKKKLRNMAEKRRELLFQSRGVPGSKILAENFCNTWSPAHGSTISAFWPFRTELDVRPLINHLYGLRYTIALPEIDSKNKPLIFREWNPRQNLIEDNYGVMCLPKTAAIKTPDWLLVPLLAFDKNGFRLGYGGGFYDITLKALKEEKNIFAIGVGFEGQMIERVPHAKHDIRLDAVLTEGGVFIMEENI